MTTFLTALTTIILPILFVAGVGFVLRRTQLITDSRPLARLALYFFTPVLVFSSIARSRLSNDDLLSLLAFMFAVALVIGVLGLLLARVLRMDRLLMSGFLLSVLFVNAGNIGLPFNQFAFGEPGLTRAAVCFVGSAVLIQTAAVFIASWGRASVGESVLAVFKMPLVYAAALGIALNRLGWALPDTLARAVDLSASAAVPLMLVILGLELGRVQFRAAPLPIFLATLVKLVITPAVAILLAELMNIRDLSRAVAVLEASMPTAVNASLVAVEFDARPDFVTGVVFVSTLGSMLTLILLLIVLGYSA